MTFTGTLIEDLFATVERVELAAQSNENFISESLVADSWFVTVQENTDYDSNHLMWHESGVA